MSQEQAKLTLERLQAIVAEHEGYSTIHECADDWHVCREVRYARALLASQTALRSVLESHCYPGGDCHVEAWAALLEQGEGDATH